MKKNTLKIISFICLIMGFAISCTTNEYEIPNDGGGNALLVSSINDGLRPGEIEVRVGDSSKYNDLSIFSEDRLWTFPEGAVDILGSSNDITTDKKEFTVVFKENEDNTPRTIEVLLQPVFNGPVPPEAATDTAFVRILPHITASFTNDLPEVDGALKLEAGNAVNFTNTSSELDNAEWVIFNNTTNAVKGDTIKTINVENEILTEFGKYTVRLRAFDDAPFSQGFASLDFEVIPANIPLEVKAGEVTEAIDETILVPFNQEIEPFTTDLTSFFSVSVNSVNFSISSIALNASDPSILDIKLNDPIYRPDVITVSYNGGGGLQSVIPPGFPTGNASVAFTDEAVTMNRDNLFDTVVYDYEDGGAGWALDGANTALITYPTDRASSGTTSMRIDNTGASQDIYNVNGTGATFNLEPGKTYLISYDVYLEAANGWQAFWPTVAGGAGAFFWQQWTDARAAAVPRDGWVTINREVEVPAAQDPASLQNLFIKLRSGGGTGIGYVDNWHMVVKEVRP